ncbi:IS5 family transposase [Halococcoides cellulosivorans]|uniref:IS5 family transposase n=1 Tax=Halococcoides cellulosivorans TaxID=1679096 RepID=A0A2R4X3Z9_9EURY|nr:IS5 family transposase [Halococcoides cellulosivorans]AWB28524.1 IS5 family transposase [Halococcoides cellulosivorans]
MKRETEFVPTKLARFTSRVVSLAQKAVVGEPDPAYQAGDGGYADWVIVAIHGLREYLDHPYRRLLDVLHEMPGIVAKLDLAVTELPDFTTVCTRKQDLKMRIWRVLLRLSAELHDTGDVQAIDATGMDRIAASQHYAKRTNYTFQAVKVTTLIDCDTNAILDIHCSMKQPHDSKIGWQMVKRNLYKLSILTADKGYDWWLLRQRLRAEGVKPVIRHREFGWYGVANNILQDDTIYHQRSNVESTFFALRRKYGEIVRARTWFGQFRELVLKCAVRNIEVSVSHSGP